MTKIYKIADYLNIKYASDIEEVDEGEEFYPELVQQHNFLDMVEKGILPEPEGSSMLNPNSMGLSNTEKVELSKEIKKEIEELNRLAEEIDSLYNSGKEDKANRLDFIFEQRAENLENYLSELETEKLNDYSDEWNSFSNGPYELEVTLASLPDRYFESEKEMLENARMVIKDITNSNNVDKISDKELLKIIQKSYENRKRKLNV